MADGVVWRALRIDEFPDDGLRAAGNLPMSIKDAIERGSKDAASGYLHATHDLMVAAHYALSRKEGARTTANTTSSRHIAAIDLRRLRQCRIHDISTEAGRTAAGIKPRDRAWRLTSDCAEVAIDGHVPKEAILGVINAKQFKVPSREGPRQTIQQFKDTTSNESRHAMRAWAQQICAARRVGPAIPKVTTPPCQPSIHFDTTAFRQDHCALSEGGHAQRSSSAGGRCTMHRDGSCNCRRCAPAVTPRLSSANCGGTDPCNTIRSLLEDMPDAWLHALYRGTAPCSAGEWVRVIRNHTCICVGRITSPQLYTDGNATLQAYAHSATNTLTPTDTEHVYTACSTDRLERCVCSSVDEHAASPRCAVCHELALPWGPFGHA